MPSVPGDVVNDQGDILVSGLTGKGEPLWMGRATSGHVLVSLGQAMIAKRYGWTIILRDWHSDLIEISRGSTTAVFPHRMTA